MVQYIFMAWPFVSNIRAHYICFERVPCCWSVSQLVGRSVCVIESKIPFSRSYWGWGGQRWYCEQLTACERPCITLVLHLCYTCVTLVSHLCHTCVTLVLHLYYTFVTLLLPFCCTWLHLCYTCVTLVLHLCYTCVTLPLRWWLPRTEDIPLGSAALCTLLSLISRTDGWPKKSTKKVDHVWYTKNSFRMACRRVWSWRRWTSLGTQRKSSGVCRNTQFQFSKPALAKQAKSHSVNQLFQLFSFLVWNYIWLDAHVIKWLFSANPVNAMIVTF